MRKIYLTLMAAAGLVFTSCSSDEPLIDGVNGYQDGKVLFLIELPGNINSRAMADGQSAKELTYVVYDDAGTFLFQDKVENAFNDRVADIRIPLVNGKSYKVAFFAKNSAAPYSITNGTLEINYTNAKANDDIYDAFYKIQDVDVSAGMAKQEVKLTRPFGQLNVGATDWADAKKAGYVVEQTGLSFTAEVYTSMSLLDGTVSNKQAVTFGLNTLPDVKADKTPVKLNIEGAEDKYDYVASAYVLVPTEQQLVSTVKFNYTGPGDNNVSLPINSVPMKRNYRTNILGKFFTSDVEYHIVIDQNFETPDYEIDTRYRTMTWAEFIAEKGLNTGVNTTNANMVIDGGGFIIISDWVDAWYCGNLTVTGMTFLRGATFSATASNLNGVVKISNNTFHPCNRPELDVIYATNPNFRMDNSGDGLCLNIETKASPNLEVIVKDNVFIGENDNTLPRGYQIAPYDDRVKNRGHAVAINAISGGGNGATAKSFTVDGNRMTGIRGNAIQLYNFDYPIVVSNNIINSWGCNASTAAMVKDDSAVRGDIRNSSGTLTLVNNYFGLDETYNGTGGLLHVNVNGYGANSPGSRPAGTYTDCIVVNGAATTTNADGTIKCLAPALPAGVSVSDLTGKAGVSVSANGTQTIFDNTVAGVRAALLAGGEVYFTPNETIAWASHLSVPKTGLVVHGNGATINTDECDFAVGQYVTFDEGSTVNIEIYNLNNARAWGGNTANCTVNVKMKNCTFIGEGQGGARYSLGLIMLRSGDSALATINMTIEDCYVEGVQVGIHTTHRGSLTLKNSTFKNVGIPVNIAKKLNGESFVANISDCKFLGCGLDPNGTDGARDYAAPVRVVDNGGPAYATTLNLTDCYFNGTLSAHDVLTMDYRSGKTWYPVQVNMSGCGNLSLRVD